MSYWKDNDDRMTGMEQLFGLKKISTVEEAILERGGQISFILKNKSDKQK